MPPCVGGGAVSAGGASPPCLPLPLRVAPCVCGGCPMRAAVAGSACVVAFFFCLCVAAKKRACVNSVWCLRKDVGGVEESCQMRERQM
jgi:hypothetical protein